MIMSQNTKSLKNNVIINLIISVSSTVFPVIAFYYASRTIGPVGVGKTSIAISYVSYFLEFSHLGIPVYGIRACAKVRDDKEKLLKTVRELLIINLALAIFTYIIFFSTLFFIPKLNNEKLIYIIVSSSILLQLSGLDWLYKALENYSYLAISSLLLKICSLFFLLFLIKSENDSCIYAIYSVMSSCGSGIINFIHARKYIFSRINQKLSFKKHLKPILLIYAMSISSSIYHNIDVVMLGFIKSDSAAGLYTTACKIKNLLVNVVTSASAVIIPRIAYNYEGKDYCEIKRLGNKAFRFVTIVTIPLVVYFFTFSKECVVVLSGEMFIQAYASMMVIVPTLFIIGLSYTIGIELFIPIGLEKFVLYSSIAGAIVDIVANSLLIPQFSATGAALGTLLAESVVLFMQLSFLKRLTYLSGVLDDLPFFTTVISSTIPILFCLPLKNIIANNLLLLSLSFVIYFLIYSILLFLRKEKLVIETFCFIKNKIYCIRDRRKDKI